MARGNFFGYETYLICEEGFSNLAVGGEIVGFQLGMRLANYRGYLLSQIEEVRVSIHGEWIPRADIRICTGKRTYTLAEMAHVVDDRWELRQTVLVKCMKRGGLRPGAHEVSAEQHVRVSYIPMVAIAYATKTLIMAASGVDAATV